MKQITMPVPARTVEIPLSVGSASVLVDVPIPAGTVPVDEAVVLSMFSQISAQSLISFLDTKGYIVERRADA